MASFDPIDFDPNAPPPRPETPPVRRGFVMVLLVLMLAAGVVYGIPYMAQQIGYRYEVGRAVAAAEALEKLDGDDLIGRSSALFRLASTRVQPAVVNVRTEQMTGPPMGDQGGGLGQLVRGAGSGVVIDSENGFVVTNHHVIQDADQIIVRLGRREFPARLVGSDVKTDIAVLQVEGRLAAEAPWGDSDLVDIGDWVLAIGSPYELDRSVTAGIVSATGRGGLMQFGDLYQDFIQTDAAINPGNSGGPLINLKGEVIGINTAILSDTGGYQGIGLAISSGLARKIVEQIIKEGRVIRGYLGVSIRDILPEEAKALGLEEPRGAQVMDVVPGGPADEAGLRPGDVVLEIDDQPVDDSNALRTRTITLPIEKSVPVTIMRGGGQERVDVTIRAMPVLLDLGLLVEQGLPGELPAELAGRLPEDGLYIVGVMPGSPAARSGLDPRRIPGLRISAVGPVPVSTVEQLHQIAAAQYDPRAGLQLQVEALDGTPLMLNLGGSDPDAEGP
ncbi:trypsin-like peptidase domain-containing protein [Tautonia plasticadhaerens]|uniref:Periplasmic serine endoprotease DegP n=1 Tax=Tautonia plasticadhaerens TaxID=2527974 RepID=A0A518GW88_9BACT|nr:trypsin-like peptidase domain-containing protein [Tautonia plasticadhaerens]QDV32866.1 Periplasmic serine endoprotease DegP precursor [Tautonia plasticadhaerens]